MAGIDPSADQPEDMGFRRRVARSEHPAMLELRRLRRAAQHARLPLPLVILRIYRYLYLALVLVLHYAYRLFVCEPLFRAACAKVGRRLRTGFFVHFVQGAGRIILGDDVLVDGKCSFLFAHRFSDAPTLTIGSRTLVTYGCTFVVAKEVSIGTDCLIAQYVHIFDSSGHSTSPARRLAGLPPEDDEVKSVHIGNNVWIGTGATIYPGVTIGEGAVVAARSVVVNHVAPNTLVAGYPARKVGELVPADTRPADWVPPVHA